MKQTIKLTERELKSMISESIKRCLNEFVAGGNDWGDTYGDYQLKNRTNKELDDVVRELHTICQYYEDLYDAYDNKQIPKMFPHINPQQLRNALNAMGNIYALMMNRSNIKGDRQSMTMDDISRECKNGLEVLAQIDTLGPINNAAIRALQKIR